MINKVYYLFNSSKYEHNVDKTLMLYLLVENILFRPWIKFISRGRERIIVMKIWCNRGNLNDNKDYPYKI